MTRWRETLSGGGGFLLAATLVQAIGQGAAMACNAVFFVDIIGLAPAQVGLTQGFGALVAMLFAAVAGQLADRWGARNTALWLALAAAGAVAAYAFVHDLIGFALVQLLVASLRMGKQVGEGALIGQLVAGRATFRAYQRSALNIGLALGTATAAVPLYLNTRWAYLTVMFFNALALAVGALLLRRIPNGPRVARRKADWRALRDVRYAAVGVLAGLVEMRDSMLTIALPLWLTNDVDAPRPTVSVLLFVNTVMVIGLQVSASRGADTVGGAVRMVRRGGFALAVACTVIGLTAQLAQPWTIVVLLAAMVCFTFGEMWSSAGNWTLSYELADPRALGQYQGVFEMTSGIGLLLGPVVATTVVLPAGAWGWLAVSVGFLLVAAAYRWVARRPVPTVELEA